MSLYAGEIIEILEKNEHGWWLGIVQRNGNVYRGYFPKNYVKEKVRVVAPAPPPRPFDMNRSECEVSEGIKAVSIGSSKISSSNIPSMTVSPSSGNRASSIRRAAFSLRSLAAFDELSDRGFAVEIAAPAGVSQATTQYAKPGDRVEMQLVGLIWDGASTDTREFGRGTLRFSVGHHSVPAALEQAVTAHMCVGQSATITAAPNLAYGAAGNPPHIPANSFVIFHSIFVSAQPGDIAPPDGPEEFFTSGVSSDWGRGSTTTNNRRDSRILLVDNSNHANDPNIESR